MCDEVRLSLQLLVFNRISPTTYTTYLDTTLQYAARTKLISNDASKATESKEVARLKGIIAKMKAGEEAEET